MEALIRGSLSACPCRSGRAYETCCGRFISGDQAAPTAEALMRSRYTAYVQSNEPYLLATWHPDTRPVSLNLDESPAPKWIGLTVLGHQQQDDTHATVEFVARYKINGRAHKLQETSRFIKQEGCWFYRDGLTEQAG